VNTAQAAVAEAFRNDWGRVVAYLIKVVGDWDLAEECAQDAFARALERWPSDGIPSSPAAWLKTTARNRAYDRIRRANVGDTKLKQIAMTESDDRPEIVDTDITDDRLRLMFTCCHPALAVEAQVALALRTLTGLTTPEIARAFLVSEETMAKRLVRAKRKIQDAGIPYKVPEAGQLSERLVAVLAVIYGLFNEGYGASSGSDLIRTNLCDEAIRLGRLLVELMPEQPEAQGLLSLMLLNNARRAARVDSAGELVILEDQERNLWDQTQIGEGLAALETARRLDVTGPFQILAAVAACHDTATTAEGTDWVEVAALYQQLEVIEPSPVVALNRAVAVAMADGPGAGLALVEEIDQSGTLSGYYLLPATKADLLRRLGRHDEARHAYLEALDHAPTDTERRYLTKRLEEIAARDISGGRAGPPPGPLPAIVAAVRLSGRQSRPSCVHAVRLWALLRSISTTFWRGTSGWIWSASIASI
jgi:RNA polymerase sigma-70 factor (ECF subfamily)